MRVCINNLIVYDPTEMEKREIMVIYSPK